MEVGDNMVRGKSISLYLIDGEINGRIKATLANWTGLAFKIPRTSLCICRDRDELKQTGVYLLFGKDDQLDRNVVYIGQACVRKNGEGILNRLIEHNGKLDENYWTEAMAITTSNDSLGSTEISYLEHRFYQLAVEANRYVVKNGNVPTIGNPSEEKQSELEDFIDYAKVIVSILGHKVFVPLITISNDDSKNITELYFKESVGIRTADGFVLKKGSKITRDLTNSCPKHIKTQREKYSDKISSDYELKESILFNSPSAAAAFVCGSNVNGNTAWKTADGIDLKKLESERADF